MQKILFPHLIQKCGFEQIMEGNSSYGGFDLQGPMRVLHHHQRHPVALHHHPRQGSLTIHENFPLTVTGCDQTVSLADFIKPDRGKSVSDEDEVSDRKKASQWHRVKWTDAMVRLLITAVSYISEEVTAENMGGSRRAKLLNLQKKGKWKSISKVMAERGHFVSPQQCEDKFNDLNKRYKRLNEILGRGTSCEVVENPPLLDLMDHVSEKGKEEVRKILSSKHLHYEEMCSYHNGNRLHLPPDPELQRSLRSVLMPRDDHDHDDNDEVEEETEFDGHDGSEENQTVAKRLKLCQGHEDFSLRNSINSLDCNRAFNIENGGIDVNQLSTEGQKTTLPQKDWMNDMNLQLEEKRLHIQVQTLELEKERFKWQRFCQKKDRELEMMKMEIERMRLENERMALELKQREMGIENN